MTAAGRVEVPLWPLLQGPHSGTTTLPALPIAPMWMCAAVARPVSFENVSVHLSLWPVSVAWNAPPAAAFLTVCFGISCAAVRLADHPIPRDAASETAVTASAHTAAALKSATNFLTMSSLLDGST